MRARMTLALLAAAAAVVPLAAVSAGPASAAVRPACPGTHPVMLYVTDDVTVTPVCAATGTVLKAIKTGPDLSVSWPPRTGRPCTSATTA